MKIKNDDNFFLKGELNIAVFEDGKPLYTETVKNLIVLAGRNLVRDLLKGDVTTGLTYFAVGTGTTAADTSDTTLETEVFRNTITQQTAGAGTLQVKYVLGSTEANGNTITEAGVFGDAATGVADTGTLFSRTTFTGVVKSASIQITFTWTYTFSAS